MTFEIQQAGIGRIARNVAKGIDHPWDSFRLEFASAGRMSGYGGTAVRAGEEFTFKVPTDAAIAAEELRKEMYVPGKGTWFGMVLTASADGRADTQFNYDEPDPAWGDERCSDIAYYDDQLAFPRDPEHIPDWLAPKLELGRIASEKFQRIADRKRARQARQEHTV